MRLWHKDLIEVLPDKQLVSQWRELSAIVGAIEKNGTPNHLLVNKVLEYPYSHLLLYSHLVKNEMEKRGFKVSSSIVTKIIVFCEKRNGNKYVKYDNLFKGWHEGHYLMQCFYNLQEKYDCGGISFIEFEAIQMRLKNLYDNAVRRNGCI